MPRRFLKSLLVVIILILLAGAGSIIYLFARAAPQYSGQVSMTGLAAPANVYRDEHGVPHIFAANINDAMRTLGYIHADERFFQMEMNRRAGAGRLSEILGPDMLEVDKFTRTMGFYRLAQESFTALSPEAQKLVQAYADGVNAWLDAHKHSLPPEFLLLGDKPESWTPADSLVWAKLMALQLSGNYKQEILRAKLAGKLSPDEIKRLFPLPPADAPVTTKPGLTKTGAIERPDILETNVSTSAERIPSPSWPAFAKELRRVWDHSSAEASGVGGGGGGLGWGERGKDSSQNSNDNSRGTPPLLTSPARGEEPHLSSPRDISSALDKLGLITGFTQAASNEWVISGTRTDSGKPILANDPHLGLEAPILWYLARIKTPDLDLEGATVPGLPVVLLGQNNHIAWGFTTTASDVQDLFIETADPQNQDQYLVPGGSAPFETRKELIKIKGTPDETLNVRVTRHGPVLSDIDPDLAALAGDGKMIALSFTALNGNDTTPEALMRINRASNWQEFLDALKLYQAPTQNIAYADRDGNIGFVGAGLVPIRKKGDGLTPVDGASGDYDWTGMIPVAQWPQIYNPPAGFIFNANNAIVGPDSAYYYGQDWEEPFRAERLQQLFNTGGKQNLDTSTAMQADIVSPVAQQLLPYLLNQKFSDPRTAQALEMLRGWNAVMDKDKTEPLIFDAWLYELHKSLLADKAGDPLKAQGPYDALAMLGILSEPGLPSPERSRTPDQQMQQSDSGFAQAGDWCKPDANCDGVIRSAFLAALDLLDQRDGSDMKQWRWGAEQKTILRNKFWSHVPVMRGLSELSVQSSGDFYTLDRGGSSVTDPDHPFERTHGPGFRAIYDLSDPAKSRFMIATGESSHVLTKHYGDLVQPWNEVKSFTLTGNEDELKAKGLAKLIFEPEK